MHYCVLTGSDIAKGGVDRWIGKWEVRKGGVQAGTRVHRLLLINSLMEADRTCAAIK